MLYCLENMRENYFRTNNGSHELRFFVCFFADTSKMWLFKLQTRGDLAQTYVYNPKTLK